MRKLIGVICAGALIFVAPASLLADEVIFKGGADGKGTAWSEPANWSTGSVPTEHDEVKIADGRTAVIDSKVGTVTKLNLGFDGEGGTVTIAKGGRLLVYRLALSGGSKQHPAVLNVEDGGYFKSHNEMYFPDQGGESGAQINISGNATFISWHGIPDFARGKAKAPVSLTIKGSKASVEIGGPLSLGGSGPGAHPATVTFIADEGGFSPLKLGANQKQDAIQIYEAKLVVDARAIKIDRPMQLPLIAATEGLGEDDTFTDVQIQAPEGVSGEIAYDTADNKVTLILKN